MQEFASGRSARGERPYERGGGGVCVGAVFVARTILILKVNEGEEGTWESGGVYGQIGKMIVNLSFPFVGCCCAVWLCVGLRLFLSFDF